jgi:hypothetical protein
VSKGYFRFAGYPLIVGAAFRRYGRDTTRFFAQPGKYRHFFAVKAPFS